ncbi:unnamed protein product [marine sediment metagenome]|uniref:Uncharacterized protein n=1 Tax=marine sediment metagenome TaxID=412755 RepID=X1DXM4_9ZZZZ
MIIKIDIGREYVKTHKNFSLLCEDGISIWKYEKSLPVSISGSIVDIETRGLDSSRTFYFQPLKPF